MGHNGLEGEEWSDFPRSHPIEMRLVEYNTQSLCFERTIRDVPGAGGRRWQLLPQCCGRGAACPRAWQLPEHRQWPNGDELDMRILQALPAAFII